MRFLPAIFSSKPKPRILVVEDNADQWFIIRWVLLQRFKEVEAIWVADVSEAMAYLEAGAAGQHPLPRLVLLDLYLPHRQAGWLLLEQIKTHPHYRSIPVIVLSRSNRLEDISQSYRLRSSAYLVKPATYDQWLQYFTHFRRYWWGTVILPKN